MKKIAISTISYNAHETTRQFLQSLSKMDMKELEVSVYVLDNYSKDALDITPSDYPAFKLTVNRSDENAGFSGGHNFNIDLAMKDNPDYVMVINNDTTVKTSMLKNLLKTFDQKKNAGMVSPKIYFYPGDEFHLSRYSKDQLGKVIWFAGGKIDWKNMLASHIGVDEFDDHRKFIGIDETEFATGACFIVAADVLKKTGFFDPKYFLYYEDADLSMKMAKKGYTHYINHDAVMWHRNAKSAGGSGSELQDYFISRNRMLFGMRYAPVRTRSALIKESLSLLNNGRTWQKRGIRDFYLRKFGKGSFPGL